MEGLKSQCVWKEAEIIDRRKNMLQSVRAKRGERRYRVKIKEACMFVFFLVK